MIKIVLLVTLFTLLGCDSGVLWQEENYKVHWVDSRDNVQLGRYIQGGPDSIGPIDGRVVGVGSNAGYLLVAHQFEGSSQI